MCNSYGESLHLGVCKLAKYVRKCIVFWRKKHSRRTFYTTVSRDGRNKFQVWIERLQTIKCVSKFSPLKNGNLFKVITLKAPADALGQLGWFVLTMVAGNLVLPLLLLPLILLSVVR